MFVIKDRESVTKSVVPFIDVAGWHPINNLGVGKLSIWCRQKVGHGLCKGG